MGIGFGTDMKDTDMVIFQGDYGGNVIDAWSPCCTNVGPGPDFQQDWKTDTQELTGDYKYHFIVTRDLVTQDQQDF